jgi:hypothetical protein
MTNILGDDRKQQILALGRLGWPLRRIEQATGVRRETASAYLKAAGIAIRAPRRRRPPPKPASQVSTDEPDPLPPGLADRSGWPLPPSRCPDQKGNTRWQSVRVGSGNVRAGTDSGVDTG